ncbi:hypothetical protein ACULLB_05380 [Enterococcus gallinarum]|uniref:hypothetical protein n=1 Tax=Enterococcus gallinarum TaxID=1353 RepID=UPI0040401E11
MPVIQDEISLVKVSNGEQGPKGDPGNQGIPGTPGENGKTSYVHWAYAWSSDGTDRFTTTYPNENLMINTRPRTSTSGPSVKGITAVATETITAYNGILRQEKKVTSTSEFYYRFMNTAEDNLALTDLKPGKSYTLSLDLRANLVSGGYLLWRAQYRKATGNWINIPGWGNKIEGISGEFKRFEKVLDIPSDAVTLYFSYQAYSASSQAPEAGTVVEFQKAKFEENGHATIYTPAPSEDFDNAYPTFAGTYTDYEPTDSEDPSKYTWQRILGESGQDGKDGENGANGQDAKEVISGYLSNESIIVPANSSGTVTDFTKALGDFIIYEGQTKVSSGVTYSKVSETGMTSTINSAGHYTVTALSADVGTATYQAVYKAVTIQKIMIVVKNKQGAMGPAGSNGTDGKGIVSNATTYQAGTSGTTPPTGTWSPSIPSVSENQYLWTRIVLTYSDNTNSTAYSVGKMGATGATGSTGATGNGIKSTTINFASSTSGTAAPSSGWSTSIPTVADGSFLWTRTVLTFTDNSTNTSYTVAKQGEKGDPTGIISQATVPTNPYVGMLWQNTGASGYIIGATYQWNGSKFNLYILTADNIVTTTLSAITANLGNITAGNISGVTISGSKFINNFSYNPNPNGSLLRSGTTTIENGKWLTEYQQDSSKGSGIIDFTGTAMLNDEAVQFSRTMVAGSGENSFAQFSALGLTMNYGTIGGTLRYQDLVVYEATGLSPASGFAQYNTSPSSSAYPTARRQGRIVQLAGAFKNNSAIPGSATERTMGTLPVWARPAQTCNFVVQGSGMNRYLLTITIDGNINCSRYGTGDQYGNMVAESWLNISCLYSAQDMA